MSTKILFESDTEITYPPLVYGSKVLFGGGIAGSIDRDIIDYVFTASASDATDFGDLTLVLSFTSSCSSTTNGLWGGGSSSGYNDTINIILLATEGNSTDFGNLSETKSYLGACSDGTSGLFGCGKYLSGKISEIDKVTISVNNDASNFGNCSEDKEGIASLSDSTKAIFAGGLVSAYTDVIEYVLFSTGGNATDFGDLTIVRPYVSGSSNGIIGLISGGHDTGGVAYIDTEYFIIANESNSSYFSDLTQKRYLMGTASDGTYGLFGGGNSGYTNIDYITFTIQSDATDFGDLTLGRAGLAACGDYVPTTTPPPELNDDPKTFIHYASDIAFNNLDLESEGIDGFLESVSAKSNLSFERCNIDNSLLLDIDIGDSFKMDGTTVNINRPMDISNINNIDIQNSAIELKFSDNNPNFFDNYICKVNNSDIFNFEFAVKEYIYVQDSSEFDYFLFENTYAKDVDITYDSLLINVGSSSIEFSDNVIGYKWEYWYGGRGLFSTYFELGGTRVEFSYVTIAIPSNSVYYGDVVNKTYYAAACSNSIIGIIWGGIHYPEATQTEDISKFQISILSNTSFFGNINRPRVRSTSCSDGILGIICGGSDAGSVITDIDRITINIDSNATHINDISSQNYGTGSCSDGIYGIICGGATSLRKIDRLLFNSSANATDYGILLYDRNGCCCCSDRTTGIIIGGYGSEQPTEITTIATSTISTYFADTKSLKDQASACSDGIKAITAGSTVSSSANIDQFIFAIQANATTFGDLINPSDYTSSCSGN